MARGTVRGIGAMLTLVVALGLAACEPLPPPEAGSQLVGCDRAAERLVLTATTHLDPSCAYTGSVEIATSGVTLDCQGARIVDAAGNGSRGILVRAPENVALTDVTVRNCKVEGFLNSLRVTRDGFRDYAVGEEYETPTADILVEKSTFKDSRGVGVYVDGYVEDVTIRASTIDGAGSTGIYLETGSRRNLVEDNSIINGGYRENGPNGQARSVGGTMVWFWGVGREGLAVDGSYENVIRRNAFFNNSNGGLFLYKNCGEYPNSGRYFERRHPADRNLIEDNTFVGGRNGIWVGSRMGENTFPMECTDPAYVNDGLLRVVHDYAADNVIRGNRFVEVTYGVRVEDDGTLVEGNTFEAATTGLHGVIVGTPYRTEVLDQPVTGTVVRANTSTLAGNAYPYRWAVGHEATTFEDNTALGAPTMLCEGEDPPRQAFIFVIAAVPGSTPPATTPDLTVPVLGELPPCTTEAPAGDDPARDDPAGEDPASDPAVTPVPETPTDPATETATATATG